MRKGNRGKIGMPRFVSLYRKDGDEGDKGGGGGDAGTFTQADIDAAVAAATGDVSGLKTKNADLLTKLGEQATAAEAWKGLDPVKVKTMLTAIEGDEILKLHTEGKHDEAYDKRVEQERATWQSKLDGVTTENDTNKTALEKSQAQVRNLIIDQQVTTNFITEKGLDTAVDDVVLRAKAAFKIEEGVPIARDEKGEIIRGADGPITVQEWVAGLKTVAPHLFPGSKGAGADGGKGGGGSGLDAKMEAAAEANDMVEYRRLSNEKKALAAK